jgi:hypothetical protein
MASAWIHRMRRALQQRLASVPVLGVVSCKHVNALVRLALQALLRRVAAAESSPTASVAG